MDTEQHLVRPTSRMVWLFGSLDRERGLAVSISCPHYPSLSRLADVLRIARFSADDMRSTDFRIWRPHIIGALAAMVVVFGIYVGAYCWYRQPFMHMRRGVMTLLVVNDGLFRSSRGLYQFFAPCRFGERVLLGHESVWTELMH